MSVAAIMQHNTSSLLALADSGIDGAGRPRRDTATAASAASWRRAGQQLVECDGGDPAGVEFVEVGNTDYRVGLEDGSFDFVWIFDGWDRLRLEQAGVDVTTIPFLDHDDCIPDWYTPLIATQSSARRAIPNWSRPSWRPRPVATRRDRGPATAADAPARGGARARRRPGRASAEYLAGQYAPDADRWGDRTPTCGPRSWSSSSTPA